jgi:hypothetical protein
MRAQGGASSPLFHVELGAEVAELGAHFGHALFPCLLYRFAARERFLLGKLRGVVAHLLGDLHRAIGEEARGCPMNHRS